MITNRYYTTTIIAIFLSLSLGILIGGTLGQQWINDNQQKLIVHYESKAAQMQEKNSELSKKMDEMAKISEKMKDDFSLLFMNSISHQIDNRKVFWINDSKQNFEPLKRTVELAGGSIYEPNSEIKTLSSTTTTVSTYEVDYSAYDAIVFFPSAEANLENYKWLLQYEIPVIYVTDKRDNMTEASKHVTIKVHQQNIDLESINEHYNFVLFLKKLFQEK